MERIIPGDKSFGSLFCNIIFIRKLRLHQKNFNEYFKLGSSIETVYSDITNTFLWAAMQGLETLVKPTVTRLLIGRRMQTSALLLEVNVIGIWELT